MESTRNDGSGSVTGTTVPRQNSDLALLQLAQKAEAKSPPARRWPENERRPASSGGTVWVMERRASSTGIATLYVMVGLPASGKTTRAKEIERDCNALRLTPDEWMIPLFADLAPRLFGESLAGDKRDVLEGRLVWLARRALQLGTNVVLDFGVWGQDERCALHHLALSVDARFQLVYLHVDDDEQARRVQGRNAQGPATAFAILPGELEVWRQSFQEPDEAELTASAPGPPPAGYRSWEEWTAEHWPTSWP